MSTMCQPGVSRNAEIKIQANKKKVMQSDMGGFFFRGSIIRSIHTVFEPMPR